MRKLLGVTMVVWALSACASDGDDGGDDVGWDATVDDFIQAGCVEAATCTGDPPASCESDVRTDMADAREALDGPGETRCIDCMTVKSREVRKVIAAACNPAAADTAAIYAACDLDPTVDFDGDGGAANDDDEACAGFP